MRALLPLLLALLALPATADIPPIHQPSPPPRQVHDAPLKHRRGGRWYMARDGHAVFCYGPTMMVNGPDGNIEKVATFCGDKAVVPLHD